MAAEWSTLTATEAAYLSKVLELHNGPGLSEMPLVRRVQDKLANICEARQRAGEPVIESKLADMLRGCRVIKTSERAFTRWDRDYPEGGRR